MKKTIRESFRFDQKTKLELDELLEELRFLHDPKMNRSEAIRYSIRSTYRGLNYLKARKTRMYS